MVISKFTWSSMASLASLKAVPKALNAVLPTPSNVHALHQRLEQKLAENGFCLAGSSYADRYAKPGDKDSQTLFVYNRGINADGTLNGKSNYNVCVLCEKSVLRVFMSNPDESPAAGKFGFDDYVRIFTYKAGSGENFVLQVVGQALEFSKLKGESAYRVYLHNHLGEFSGAKLNAGLETKHTHFASKHDRDYGGMKDDGNSSDQALLINLLLNNADYCAITHHNNFLPLHWKLFEKRAQKYGVQLIPGFEATLPIHEYDPWLAGTPAGKNHTPNGPHIVLLFQAPEVAEQFWASYFSDRRQYRYAPTASANVDLEGTYRLIEKSYPGSVARLVAHPMCGVRLPDVGVVNRAAKGEITVQQMLDTIRRSDGIAMFNLTLDEEELDMRKYMRQVDGCDAFSKEEKSRRKGNIVVAYKYFSSLLQKHGLGESMSSNNINAALAKECSQQFGILQFEEPDSHDFDFFYTKFGPIFYFIKEMGEFAKGHNTLLLPQTPGKKPSPSEVVSFMLDNVALPGATWSSCVFSEFDGRNLVITSGRQDMPWYQKLYNKAEGFFSLLSKVEVLWKDAKGSVERGGSLLNSNRGSIPD